MHCTQVALLVKATGELRKMKHIPGIKPISDILKECILLAGETKQRMNSIPRAQFKPSIPYELKDLCTSTDEKAEWLFGDNLQESLKVIKSKNALREEFAKKSSTKGGGKRKHQAGKVPVPNHMRNVIVTTGTKEGIRIQTSWETTSPSKSPGRETNRAAPANRRNTTATNPRKATTRTGSRRARNKGK